MMHKAWSSIEEVPYCFSRSSVKFQGHTTLKVIEFDPDWVFPDCNSSFNTPMVMKWCTKLEFTDGYEMMHRAWSSIVEVPCCFSRSSVKFQGQTALKIVEFDPNWPFPDCNSSLNSPMAMKCCTKLETAKERCPIVFQGHPSIFKVTRYKTSPILTQIRCFRTIGQSQLSNPSDLPCSVVVCLRCLLHHILSLIAYTFRENREFVFIIIVQFMMSANSRICFALQIVLVCLYSTPSHYHHCAKLSEDIELIKCLSDKFCVWVRLSIFSQLSIIQSIIQYVGLCVFQFTHTLVMIERIYILCLIIIIKSEVWTITHCLGLSHETMMCAVCLSIFFLKTWYIVVDWLFGSPCNTNNWHYIHPPLCICLFCWISHGSYHIYYLCNAIWVRCQSMSNYYIIYHGIPNM